MRQTYSTFETVPISPVGQTSITSKIEVGDDVDEGGVVLDVDVAVLIEHSYVGDLVLILQGPGGQRITLADRVRGSADDYDRTVFDDEAARWIESATGDALGIYRPTEALAGFDGIAAAGEWTLNVIDLADRDGGQLLAWALSIEYGPNPNDAFTITVDFDGGLTARQREAFSDAATRWESIITTPLREMRADRDRTTTGLVISARGITIDGPDRILGQAQPTFLRPGSGLPYLGIMEFDSADLFSLERDGLLQSVILHEMAHVLGIGTIWRDLIGDYGGEDPRYLGPAGNAQWQAAGGVGRVPIANTGGDGTRDGHWREQDLGPELMTGFLSGASQPLSAITIGCLEDLGYGVNYREADPFSLSVPAGRTLMRTEGDSVRLCQSCAHRRYPPPVFAPPEDIVA